MACNVCCDKYNKSTKSEVVCRFDDCKYAACKECVRTYLTNTTAEPHCMKCRKKWDLEFLKANLNASFMQTEYRDHRKNILIDSAISKMSEHYANAIIYNNQKKAELEIRKKTEKIDALHKEISNIYKEITAVRNSPDLVLKKSSEERRKFVMPCQSNGCRGMLSSSYKCDLCEKYTCAQCFASIIGEKADHACKEEDMATAEELRRNSKPCPQCGARISKIDGCDQMWCVECKTAFSWNRGTIETGNVHNPHFFQWMRQTGGQIGALCGREDNYAAISSIKEITFAFTRYSYIRSNYVYNFAKNQEECESHYETARMTYDAFQTTNKKFFSMIAEAESYFFKFYRFINHMDRVELRHVRDNIRVREEDNMLFYKYILNECDKDVLAEFLIRRDVLNVKDSAYRDILDAFVNAGRQIIEEFNKEFSMVLAKHVKEKIGSIWTMVSRESKTRSNTTQIDVSPINLFFFIYETSFLHSQYKECLENAQPRIMGIIDKYYKIIDNYTNYTNLEILRYFVLYNIRRQVMVWNHECGEEETLRFDSKSEIVQKIKEYSEKIENESDENDEDTANDEQTANDEPVANQWV